MVHPVIDDLCCCSAVGNSLLCFRFRVQSRASASSTGGEQSELLQAEEEEEEEFDPCDDQS